MLPWSRTRKEVKKEIKEMRWFRDLLHRDDNLIEKHFFVFIDLSGGGRRHKLGPNSFLARTLFGADAGVTSGWIPGM